MLNDLIYVNFIYQGFINEIIRYPTDDNKLCPADYTNSILDVIQNLNNIFIVYVIWGKHIILKINTKFVILYIFKNIRFN